MNETVNVHIWFTDEARRQVNARHGDFAVRFKAPSGIHLAKGDLVEFKVLDGMTFVVLGRIVKFIDEQEVKITYLLDLASGEDEGNKLRVVREGEAPGQ